MFLKKISMLMVGFGIGSYAQEAESVDNNTFWIWILLFTLGAISILILFISSREMAKMKKMHEDVLNKQLEMEQKQILILTNMSENIHNVAKEALAKSTQAIEKINASSKSDMDELINAEDTLLDVTNDLIEFLRLKSKKVEIINEEFNLNNVLNELSGIICSRFNGSKVELIFDIDNSIPRRLIGDSLQLGQILNNILENTMETLTDEELKLKISMLNTFEDKVELQFQMIDSGMGMTEEALDSLFTPYYDEESGIYVGLGLFVAKELIGMMDGELSAQSSSGKGSTFTITLPFTMVDPANKRRYRLPTKELTDKKVFIVDSSYSSALAIKKMFAYFKHDVTVISIEKFMQSKPKLTSYDIVILDENLLSFRTLTYLKQIKKEKELKVISLNSLLRIAENKTTDDIVDKVMMKPLNQERVFEMISSMYEVKTTAMYTDNIDDSKKAKIHTSTILEAKNIKQESFSVFNGKRILIVEDNIINQKVLVNIFHLSGIELTIANNGQEAVNLVTRAQAKVFDLILMDINMPVMDGFDATQAIRDEQKFDILPIVAFTALVLDSEIQKMFSSGMNAFLAKPLNIGQLYAALAMFLLDTSNKYNVDHASPIVDSHLLPGLNIEVGIKYSNNSEALYVEILKEFIEAYGESDEVFSTLVNEHRYEQLKMLCLDMRGLSATIGAEDMYIKIDEVQKLLLYNKHNLLDKYISIYRKELAKMGQSIDLYLQNK